MILALFVRVALAEEPAASIYDRMMSDGRLDITIALGFSEKNGHNQPAPTGDPAVDSKNALPEDVVNRRADVDAINRAISGCKECGFKLTHSTPGVQIYEATITRQGKPVAVKLNFIHPDENVTAETLKAWFRWGAKHDDVVLYAGHSRRGAGFPDFGPSSVLNGKVFYKNPSDGNWRGLADAFATDKYQLVALNSCKSKRYYESVLRKEIRNKKPKDFDMVLTNDDSYFEDYPATSVALVRGLMLQKPRAEVMNDMENVAAYFRMNEGVGGTKPQFYATALPTDISPEKVIDVAANKLDSSLSPVVQKKAFDAIQGVF